MKIVIKETERGFLFKNGKFLRMLVPGKHRIHSRWGETHLKTTIGDQVDIKQTDIHVLLRDKNFAACVTKIEVPDCHIAVYNKDGRIAGALKPGQYYYWNIFHKYTFQLINTCLPRVALPKDTMLLIPTNLYSRVEVHEGQAGLLFYDGKYQEKLGSGSYYFWNGAVKVTCQLIDLRIQQLDINSQEILTADKVTLRLNFVCTYKITDPVRIYNALKNHQEQIYVATQLALREYIGHLRFDELLEQKNSLAEIILGKLREKQGTLFVEFISAGLKDIILPGEIRDIMNTVLIAEKTAQANVIARREEVASTRSLLNTAKLMDENTTLYKLKELEYLERICDKVGNISVGNGNLLQQLSDLLRTKPNDN
ncbi:MAG: slipin family protein [Gracilibacteraceae bacterium]|jgi:regulator of protease activity HflC (stomatin/prohibitin superfamily)|nr:slipin family protein [Gracilibacteraceae bacterium]